MNSSTPAGRLQDDDARDQAKDPSVSCIVQAPAGSGKTTLLVHRFAELLAGVEAPEQALAITFTRKAAAEMRTRMLDLMSEPLDEKEQKLADGIRKQDEKQGWRLAQNPARLKIQTIDSLAATLARRLPFDEAPGADVAEDPSTLYEAAARRTLERLLTDDGAEAVQRFLGLFDNNAGAARRILVQMLATREQWLEVARTLVEKDVDDLFKYQNEARKCLVDGHTNALKRDLGPTRMAQLKELTEFATGHGGPNEGYWRNLQSFCLTNQGEFRKQLTVKQGFPAQKKDLKKQALQCITELAERDADLGLRERLVSLGYLPLQEFSDDQVDQLRAVCETLILATADLASCIQEQGVRDFIAVNQAAMRALERDGEPTKLARVLDYRIQHILVDEFQDTSWANFHFFEQLIEGWSGEAGRSFFAVGDPMQSIYRFRNAEVGLFERAGREGINQQQLAPLKLQTNFRSAPALIDWFNSTFRRVFPEFSDVQAGAVSCASSVAGRPLSDADADAEAGARVRLFQDAAAERTAIIAHVRRLMRMHGADADIAILGRSRTHLDPLRADLEAAGIAWRGTGIHALADMPVVTDLLSLAASLESPEDRLAWMSLLRAPWVGLGLPDLEVAACLSKFEESALTALAKDLSSDGRRRLLRFLDAMRPWDGHRRFEQPPRSALERIWIDCGGPAAYPHPQTPDGSDMDAPAEASAVLDQAERFFELVDELGGEGYETSALRQAVQGLFVEDAGERGVQLLTIHRAKGLEFEHVIVPALNQGTRSDSPPALRWQRHSRGFLLAAAKDAENPLYDWLAYEDKSRAAYELQRLLYVACTRARTSLLLTASQVKEKPRAGSLLQHLWRALPADAKTVETGTAKQGALAPSESDDAPGSHHRLISEFHWRPKTPLPLNPSRISARRNAADAASKTPDVIIGTLVHEELRALAEAPLPTVADIEAWVQARRPLWQRRLGAAGLPAEQIPEAITRCQTHLERTLRDDTGRWILGPREAAASEHGVTGLIAGETVNAYFDRTFVADGKRWIIDFKTDATDGSEASITRIRQQHTQQLENYRTLAAALYGEPIRTALYLTALPRLVEMH